MGKRFKVGDRVVAVDWQCCGTPRKLQGTAGIIRDLDGGDYYLLNMDKDPSDDPDDDWFACDDCLVSENAADAVNNKFPMKLPIDAFKGGFSVAIFKCLLHPHLPNEESRKYLSIFPAGWHKSPDGLSIVFFKRDS